MKAPSAHPPRIAVAAPLACEARALRRGAPQLEVLRTGMGPLRAARAAQRLATHPAGALAVAGLAGALSPELAPGDLVVATELRGAAPAAAPPLSASLCRALERYAVTVHAGPILSVDHPVRGRERDELAASGALAVDMESAWIAPAAQGRPFAVLRVVVDAPGYELWRAGTVLRGLRALGRLRQVAPALDAWARDEGANFEPRDQRRA